MLAHFFRRPGVSDLLAANASQPCYNTTIINSENGKNQLSNQPSTLKRVYNLRDLILFGICNVVGSGIYVLAGSAGKNEVGPALLISFVIGLFTAGYSALAYAEFASRIPVVGGTFTYMFVSSGELPAFLVGWTQLSSTFGSCAINAIGASAYLRSFLQSFDVKVENTLWFGENDSTDIISINLVAPLLIIILTLFVLYDIKLTTVVTNAVATINILILLLFIVSGFVLFNDEYLERPCDFTQFGGGENGTGECPSNVDHNSFFPFGYQGVFYASTITFWSFSGLEQLTAVAEECIHPLRDIPRAMYIVLALCFILYECISLAMFGMVPFQSLDEEAALSQAFAVHNEKILQRIFSFGAFSTMSMLLFSKLITCPRMLYRMSVDGLLCKIFKYAHPVTQSPLYSVGIFSLLTLIIAMFFDLTSVLDFSSTANLSYYTFILTGCLVLRYSPPSNSCSRRVSSVSLEMVNEDRNDSIDILAATPANNSTLSTVKSRTSSSFLYIGFDELKDSLTPETNQYWTEKKIFIVFWTYCLMCLVGSFIILHMQYFADKDILWIWVLMVMIAGGIVCIQFLIIIYLDHILPWKEWIDKQDNIVFMPFSPALSLIVIALDNFLMANLGIIPILQMFAVWIIGFFIYICYGYNHSTLNANFKKMESITNAEIVDDCLLYTH